MALDKFERANLKRLLQCVAPNQKRIDRIKKKIRDDAKKASETIEELERQNAGFMVLIEELQEKDAQEDEPEEEDTIKEDLEAMVFEESSEEDNTQENNEDDEDPFNKE